ncbi:hypothetical protein BK651_13095 [Pseudomonas rhodesiae]|nr:hypothetical protein BK650_17945 [Pseudomonas rhodesiae]ROM65382.1 hypothetical protein BK651_13095 [Pseudomonas rhodesiae]
MDLPSTTYRVLTAIGELRLPNLVQASGIGASQTLAPLTALNGGTVEVSYDGMLTTDIIKVTMVGNGAAGSPNIPEKNGSISGTVSFPIPAHAIGVNIGRTNQTFTLQYKVTRNGSPKDSGVVTVTVTPIPVGNMPRPLINNIPAGATLDLNTFVGDALAALAKWPFSAAGQRVWLICSSANVGDRYVLNGEPISQSEATNGLANKPVLRTWLESVPNGQQIELKAQVTLDGSQTPGRETPFQSTTYKVSQAFQIDRSDMDLNGYAIIAFWGPPAGDYAGNNGTRVATGGKPPYTYTSRHPAIASVSSAGKVKGLSNGVTTIDVRDQAGNWLSYNVYVSNVYLLRQNASSLKYDEAIAWRNSLPGGSPMSYYGGIEEMMKAYGPVPTWPLPRDGIYWLCLEDGCNYTNKAKWVYDGNTVVCAQQYVRSWAWCKQLS